MVEVAAAIADISPAIIGRRGTVVASLKLASSQDAEAVHPFDHFWRQLGQRPKFSRALREGSWITGRWRLGPVHADLPSMKVHVIATSYGGGDQASFRSGRDVVAFRPRRDAFSLFPIGTAGRMETEKEMETSHVYLSEDRLQDAAKRMGCAARPRLLRRLGFSDPQLSAILTLLADAAADNRYSPAFAEQCVDLLCMRLIASHSSEAALAEAPRSGLAEWQVRRVTDHMRKHLDQPISLDDLAGLVGLSRFHFCTAFRRATGQTPLDWLCARRIERSVQLLEETPMTVTEIALEVGYETPSSFTARFRREMSVTPSEHRRRTTLQNRAP